MKGILPAAVPVYLLALQTVVKSVHVEARPGLVVFDCNTIHRMSVAQIEMTFLHGRWTTICWSCRKTPRGGSYLVLFLLKCFKVAEGSFDSMRW